MKKSKVNPFLLQRQISQVIRSLPKEKKDLLGQAYINILNDVKIMPLEEFKLKYINSTLEAQ